MIGGLLGAKIYYVILVGDITTLWSRGGFVFWGGLIGGIIAVFAVIHRKQLNPWRISDVAGIGIAAAYSIGRTGCWAVGDDYGRPWSSRFAVSFPDGAPPSTAANLAAFHSAIPAGVAPSTVLSVYPTQLLEVALGFGMFLILWHLRDHKHAEGWLLGVYMVLRGSSASPSSFCAQGRSLRASHDGAVSGDSVRDCRVSRHAHARRRARLARGIMPSHKGA